jgi:hypothetical protein
MWSKLAVLVVVVAAASAFAQRGNQQMQPRRANTGIYANETREAFEQPVATVGPNDILTVIETRRRHYRVRTASGVEGFVESNAVSAARAASGGGGGGRGGASTAFAFEAAEVIGYLDNPTPVFIIDVDGMDSDPITLDRSFREALKENVDRETVERLTR